MKAIAFQVENELVCCMCALQIAEQSGYPHLFFCMVKQRTVNKDHKCPKCGYWYGSHDAECAADQIVGLLKD